MHQYIYIYIYIYINYYYLYNINKINVEFFGMEARKILYRNVLYWSGFFSFFSFFLFFFLFLYLFIYLLIKIFKGYFSPRFIFSLLRGLHQARSVWFNITWIEYCRQTQRCIFPSTQIGFLCMCSGEFYFNSYNNLVTAKLYFKFTS